jgi:hypothetical protein
MTGRATVGNRKHIKVFARCSQLGAKPYRGSKTSSSTNSMSATSGSPRGPRPGLVIQANRSAELFGPPRSRSIGMPCYKGLVRDSEGQLRGQSDAQTRYQLIAKQWSSPLADTVLSPLTGLRCTAPSSSFSPTARAASPCSTNLRHTAAA